MLLVLLALLISTSLAFAAPEPVAVYTPDRSSGIEVVQNPDGQTAFWTHTGPKALVIKRNTTPPSHYIYMKLDPSVRAKLGPDVWLVVDFQDVGISRTDIEYNAPGNPYTRAEAFTLVGSSAWYSTLIHLPNARLVGAQNAGADFRFAGTGHVVISKVEVYTEKPNVALVDTQTRLKKMLDALPKSDGPKNISYCFGNDADESTAPVYKALGVTCVESYVTWETCEGKGEGEWDWSRWDRQVEILGKYDLKWAPFIILGPAYSTPNWFRASKEHFPCRCLEHDTDSKI